MNGDVVARGPEGEEVVEGRDVSFARLSLGWAVLSGGEGEEVFMAFLGIRGSADKLAEWMRQKRPSLRARAVPAIVRQGEVVLAVGPDRPRAMRGALGYVRERGFFEMQPGPPDEREEEWLVEAGFPARGG